MPSQCNEDLPILISSFVLSCLIRCSIFDLTLASYQFLHTVIVHQRF